MSIGEIQLLAHRGGMARAPENTLEAFNLAIADGADAIECDVQLSADGEPIVFHDDDVRRATGRRGLISKMTWKEIKDLRVLGHAPIPHLEDVLGVAAAWPAGEFYFDLHQNSLKLVDVLASQILTSGLWQRCFILGFYSKRSLLLHAASFDPRVHISVMPQEPWNIESCVDQLGVDTLCLGWGDSLTRLLYRGIGLFYDVKSAVELVKKNGVRVGIGVANTEADIRFVLKQGATGVWTDDIPLARRVISSVPSNRPSNDSSPEGR
jgi:glycerophosphoryl diester phosphodiesterase